MALNGWAIAPSAEHRFSRGINPADRAGSHRFQRNAKELRCPTNPLSTLSEMKASGKEFPMKANHPNRIKKQIAGFDQILQKKSGDQHIEPEDEPAEAPHRPHRVNREDMQKIMPADTDKDDLQSP
jgi:hypothetical protein